MSAAVATDNRPKQGGEANDNIGGSFDREDVGPTMGRHDDEGVEVVLESMGKSSIVEAPRSRGHDQNVFRPPHAVRPRAVRAPHGGPPPYVSSAGSYGGYPPHSEYGHRPYPVPYNPSGSFEEGANYPPPSHYSPHVQYPPPGGRHHDDVNVISPNHKTGERRPPVTPSSNGYGPPRHAYHYPPTSPVSRPGGPPSASPSRAMRNYRRPDGPYSAATRGHEEAAWGAHPPHDRSRPPLVAESSFDSEHYSSRASHASHPTTPNAPHYGPPRHQDPHYGPGPGPGPYGASFGGSFDSHAPPPPHHSEDYRYYGHRSPHHPPESPYSPYSQYDGYSPGGGYYDHYSPHPDYGHHPRSYEDEHGPNTVTPGDRKKASSDSGIMLPKAAHEVDFDIADPPAEPVTQPSKTPVCESPADVNSYDVLCGRGGGTNSQIGNRRFRKLVQEFQPTYLLARRKEKPLLARTIVLIIRKRGGRFLKKDEETGELFEVGDAKAEAKTSQALREGLDVRATKSAASNLLDKKKKKKGKSAKDDSDDEDDEPEEVSSGDDNRGSKVDRSGTNQPQSPPTLPRLSADEKPVQRAPSPESMQFRKRRRMRSKDADDPTPEGCGIGFQDKLFPDFCPPRADIGRMGSPTHDLGGPMDFNTPIRTNSKIYEDDDDIRYETEAADSARGCANIALDMVTGAAAGSFCLGPRRWR